LNGGRASPLNYRRKQRADEAIPDRRAENTLFSGYGNAGQIDMVSMVSEPLSIRGRGARAA